MKQSFLSTKAIVPALYFLLILLAPVHGQVGVVVIQDSPDTMKTRIQDFMHQIEMAEKTVEQLRLATVMIENQVRTIESLSEGDFEHFAEAFTYQTNSIMQFSELIDGFDYLGELEDFQAILESEEFDVFRTDVRCLSDSMRSSNNLLQKTLSLVKNTEYRLERQKDIRELSQSTSSVTGQLQLTNESLGLLSSELQDILIASVAMNNMVATEEKNTEIKQELKKRYAEEFFDSNDTSAFESEVSDDQYIRAIFGRLDGEE